MKGLGTRAWGLAGALAVLTFGGLLAQTPAPQPPTFRTEANYVRVDVFPTAKDGAPVMDLTQADFDVLESGAPQKIEQFEHVVIHAVSENSRRDPNTVAEARAMLENGRARVFVVFLDIGHVTIEGSHRIRQPLTDTLNRLIGPDDLVGVMTPDMSPSDIAFARKTSTIEGFLARHWTWGESDQRRLDPIERIYESCFPGVSEEMIERRRQKFTLDAYRDLAIFLRGVREERKAIIAVSDGFLLLAPNPNLMAPRAGEQPPTGKPIGVVPGTGRLGATDTNNVAGASQADCWRDRQELANYDGQNEFRRMLDLVNRANASFYPVNPRGLEVFDSPISGALPLTVDLARIRARTEMLQTLAGDTDGVAVVNTNDLGGAMKRIVDDLSSYYLLGYYSSGKLDGRFHSITVRVKRPGVQVRARRGYLAASPTDAAELAAARAAAASRVAEVAPETAAAAHAVEAAIAPLSGYARDVPMRLQMAAGWKPGDAASASLWVVGELGGVATVGDAWNEGFDATVTLTTPADATVATGRISVPRGGRTFRVALTPSQPLAAGEYVLRVGARAGPASIPSRDTARLVIPAAPASTGALFVRRGVTTGNREVPTADLRFRRSEQVRVEIPAPGAASATARLLDRTGKPLAVPVTAAVRDDADGSRWVTAQLGLAPLAPSDYAIEISIGDQRMISAFRVVP